MARTKDFCEVIRAELRADPALAADVAVEALLASIAIEIIRAREAAGWSQAELGRRAGVGQATVSKVEVADYDPTRLRTLVRLAAALGLELKVTLGPKGT
jgi:HTH-type transcriptional regulator / antitoxin HipB